MRMLKGQREPHVAREPRFDHPCTRAISKNALSFYLREVISGAGALGVLEGQSLRAHSIRSVSTSVTFLRNWSVAKVLEAATWCSNSVFSLFYLKDVAYVLGAFCIGGFCRVPSLGRSFVVPLRLTRSYLRCSLGILSDVVVLWDESVAWLCPLLRVLCFVFCCVCLLYFLVSSNYLFYSSARSY